MTKSIDEPIAAAVPDPSDDALVRAARDGEERAFELLLERHEGRVLRVLRLMGVPRQDREDVAQEVFVRVFRHLGGFQHGRPFRSWVYRIAVNASHDYRRSRSRRTDDAPLPEQEPEAAPAPGGAAETVAAAELRDRLHAALGLLSDRERAVFVLREIEGLDGRSVARVLGITQITVRRHLGRARRRLQVALGPRAGGNSEGR